jgi:Mn2+/Fe2+ NRAMP family transporter|tara:strand:- start:2776 stop:3975 length:1200 start_codon:yes stop_codon:yes gene_type:complete
MKITLGPGAIVAAAFIGPGTIATAAAAGASSGITLLWAILLSVAATLVLQELSVRSALATNRDLAALIRLLGERQWWGGALAILVLCAIGVGNAAYQSGNLSGAGLGLGAVLPVPFAFAVIASSLVSASLILLDRYRVLERVLVILVVLMACLFIGLAVFCMPELFAMHHSLILASDASNTLTLVLALIGTTVVPYNLFLHATAARRRWLGVPLAQAIQEARTEATLAITLGGIMTISVMVVATVVLQGDSEGPILERLMTAIDHRIPGVGTWVVGGGLFAAGLTSAIAAPIAAGWTVCGVMGWSTDAQSRPFKFVALNVLGVGLTFALLIPRPDVLIIAAQATNAVLLPLIAGILLIVANSALIPALYRNRRLHNGVAASVILLVLTLGLSKVISLVG